MVGWTPRRKRICTRFYQFERIGLWIKSRKLLFHLRLPFLEIAYIFILVCDQDTEFLCLWFQIFTILYTVYHIIFIWLSLLTLCSHPYFENFCCLFCFKSFLGILLELLLTKFNIVRVISLARRERLLRFCTIFVFGITIWLIYWWFPQPHYL